MVTDGRPAGILLSGRPGGGGVSIGTFNVFGVFLYSALNARYMLRRPSMPALQAVCAPDPSVLSLLLRRAQGHYSVHSTSSLDAEAGNSFCYWCSLLMLEAFSLEESKVSFQSKLIRQLTTVPA